MAGRRDGRPRNEQIAADLRARIMSGEYGPGDRLPSTPQMVENYASSSATIQRALGDLQSEGLIDRRPGLGVFVRARQMFTVRASAYFPPTPGGYSYQVLFVAEADPPADVAGVIGEEPRAILRQRLMLHADEPLEVSWSYYPAAIAAGTPLAGKGKIRGGAPQALADLGYPQRYVTDVVSSRSPTTEELEQLDLPDDVPVIRQFRVAYSDNDVPVEVSILIKGAHRYALQYDLPAD